jgi:hypothetical protein
MNTKDKPMDDRYRAFRGGACENRNASLVSVVSSDCYTPAYCNPILGFRAAQTGCRQILKGVNLP